MPVPEAPRGSFAIAARWARRQRQAALAGVLTLTLTAAAPGDPTAAACGAGAPATMPRLYATVTGARKVAGNITFTLYGPRPEAFLAHKGSIALTRVMLATTEATACFAVSMPGSYAVAVYHDQNDNHHFDRTLIGLPAEGYGFSNNPAIIFRPPSFGATRFQVKPGDNRITIRLIY